MTFVVAVAGYQRPRRAGDESVVRTAVKCGSCETPIGVGEVYALVTEAQLKRCFDCALGVVQAWIHADWTKAGWCPWPSQLEDETARRLKVAMETSQTDVVPVIDFDERLRVAIERSQRAA